MINLGYFRHTPDPVDPHQRRHGRAPENSLLFALALRKAKVPLEMHVFEKGRHGLGLGGGEKAFAAWPKLAETWLAGQGFLAR
ncbi:MAG: hypothetical protein U0835_06595 [Isosphaeraceae bacterium]